VRRERAAVSKKYFLALWESLNISFRFFSGFWNSFDPLKIAGPTGYDIVLTSETIYRTESLPPLLNLMASACTGKPTSLEGIVSSLSIKESGNPKDYLCLVAAKVLYFGVGGGVSDFVRAVEGRGGRIETVLERTAGVGRKIMRVQW
jgi:protein-histidine N-methyltransferase